VVSLPLYRSFRKLRVIASRAEKKVHRESLEDEELDLKHENSNRVQIGEEKGCYGIRLVYYRGITDKKAQPSDTIGSFLMHTAWYTIPFPSP
jgi:hypothetical protein